MLVRIMFGGIRIVKSYNNDEKKTVRKVLGGICIVKSCHVEIKLLVRMEISR